MIIRSAIKRDVRKINELFHEQLPDSYAEYHEMNLPPHKPAGEFQWGSRDHFSAVAYTTHGYASVMIGAVYMAPRSQQVFNPRWRGNLLGHVENLAVMPEYQGQGIGTRLLEMCAEFARHQKWSRLALYVRTDRTQAIDFYHAVGFVILNQEPRVVESRGQTYTLYKMAKELKSRGK